MGILQRRSVSQGETALYRHIVFLCSIVIAVLSTAAAAARTADSERCQELGRRLEVTKSQITAIEVSLTLFSAVEGNCEACLASFAPNAVTAIIASTLLPTNS